jgi:hypothetical protein
VPAFSGVFRGHNGALGELLIPAQNAQQADDQRDIRLTER